MSTNQFFRPYGYLVGETSIDRALAMAELTILWHKDVTTGYASRLKFDNNNDVAAELAAAESSFRGISDFVLKHGKEDDKRYVLSQMRVCKEIQPSKKEDKLATTRSLAVDLMNKHGLIAKGWTFSFDNAKRRFGCCNFTEMRITLSEDLVKINNVSAIQNTILHEIAHALAGSKCGHDDVWRDIALKIGCDGKRCYDSEEVNTPDAKYEAICKGCSKEFKMHRISKKSRSCPACSNGKYNAAFKLEFVQKW